MFDPVTLSWGDKTYSVPFDKQMILIEKIESALVGDRGVNALHVLLNEGPTYVELSRAYAAALQHAGCEVTQYDIYMKIQEDIAEMSENAVATDLHAKVMGLLSIISPPVHQKLLGSGDGKKPKKAAKG